jgi:hypothetical protein
MVSWIGSDAGTAMLMGVLTSGPGSARLGRSMLKPQARLASAKISRADKILYFMAVSF